MDESPRRNTTHPFPTYAFIPGKNAHPRRNPHGHSYGQPEPKPVAFLSDQWRTSEDYRYAVDLFNAGFWWECHEVFEGLWHAVGEKTEQGSCFQALIDLAAGNLKLTMKAPASTIKLWGDALARLEKLPSLYMGLDIRSLENDVRLRLANLTLPPLLLRLQP
jgi:predicted metal-dependent hydrolase